MTNPSKAKGTAAETALRHDLEDLLGRKFRRTPPGCKWDLETADHVMDNSTVFRILATRPDRGRWLLTMPLVDWATLNPAYSNIRVEVKRYKSFSIHSIFEAKFGD